MKAQALSSQLETVGSAGSSPQGYVGVQPKANMSCLGFSCQCWLAARYFKLIPSQKTRKNYGSISLSVRQGCGQCFFKTYLTGVFSQKWEKRSCRVASMDRCSKWKHQVFKLATDKWQTLVCILTFDFKNLDENSTSNFMYSWVTQLWC